MHATAGLCRLSQSGFEAVHICAACQSERTTFVTTPNFIIGSLFGTLDRVATPFLSMALRVTNLPILDIYLSLVHLHHYVVVHLLPLVLKQLEGLAHETYGNLLLAFR